MVFNQNGEPNLLYTSSLASLRGKRDGRLMHYNRKTRVSKTLSQNFVFANGIAFDADEKSIFVLDTSRLMILRYWLQNGKLEVADDGFPCFPDNLVRSDKLGGFLAGCPIQNSKLLEFAHKYPILKRLLSYLPQPLTPFPPPFGGCVHLDENGKIVHVYSDQNGAKVHGNTHCMERDNNLYMSGLQYEGVAVYNLKGKH